MSPTERATWEALYRILLSAVVLLAQKLDKPCPVETRKDRRRQRDLMVK